MRFKNRLQFEKSPYLLQHADNPVDWYPWGEEAFEHAEREDRPIFLSIGYSTCHWCHVMERESFQDEEVARLMNETFISIKVDREERPDIDSLYMKVCQMITGGGGWPLTIIMTQDKKPFFAGTYFPKGNSYGRIGMLELIPKIKTLWNDNRDQLIESSEEVMKHLQDIFTQPLLSQDISREDVLHEAYERFWRDFDRGNGGFERAPKFPIPHIIGFLLRYYRRTGERNALVMVDKTLRSMRFGGIYDHVGFGFHRYSTDEKWIVPHFEKMLYDQALIANAYIEGFQVTGNGLYESTAKEIFEYVMTRLISPEGAFFSSEDAESEGEEGKFYIWTLEELGGILEKGQLDIMSKVFNIEESGNFTDEISKRKTGRNILYRTKGLRDIGDENDLSEKQLSRMIEEIRLTLYTRREERVKPSIDDKILTDWNALMISALSKGARVFNEKKYLDAALKAANFIIENMIDSNGRLMHRYREGKSDILAFVDDYAFFINALIELYEATFEIRYLEIAIDLNRRFIEHFWDKDNGGFFQSSDESEEILFRIKESFDGAVPSGNSIAMLNLLRLGKMLGYSELYDKGGQIGRANYKNIRQSPTAFSQLLCAVDFLLGPINEAVIVGGSKKADTELMINELNSRFFPNLLILFKQEEGDEQEIASLAEHTRDMKAIDGKATAYICRDFECNPPITDIDEILNLVNSMKKSSSSTNRDH